MQKYYTMLSVEKNSSKEEILKAYENLIEGDPENRLEMQTAYRVLTTDSGAHLQSLYNQMSIQSQEAAEQSQILSEQGKSKQAISLLNMFIKTEKNSDYLLFLISKAQAANGAVPSAFKIIKKLNSKYPENVFFMELYLVFMNMSGKELDDVLGIAEKGYGIDRQSFTLLSFLCEKLERDELYEEALEYLTKALNDRFMSIHLWWIFLHCAAIYMQLDRIQEALKCVENLSHINLDNEQMVFQVGNTILSMTEELINRRLMPEATICLRCAEKILPDNEQTKAKILLIQKLIDCMKILHKVEKDNKVPQGLVTFLAGELMPLDNMVEDEKQIEAYRFMSEYHFIQEYQNYMVGIKYLEKNFPELYAIKKQFFDSIREPKKRKDLQTYYFKNVSKYEQIVEDLMDGWEEIYNEYYTDEDDDYEDDYNDNYKDNYKDNYRDKEPSVVIKPSIKGKVIPFRKRDE